MARIDSGAAGEQSSASQATTRSRRSSLTMARSSTALRTSSPGPQPTRAKAPIPSAENLQVNDAPLRTVGPLQHLDHVNGDGVDREVPAAFPTDPTCVHAAESPRIGKGSAPRGSASGGLRRPGAAPLFRVFADFGRGVECGVAAGFAFVEQFFAGVHELVVAPEVVESGGSAHGHTPGTSRAQRQAQALQARSSARGGEHPR